ncbi:DUF4390 domain-containing protein [Thioalkalivibrio sp. XN8]|uniref:DUF4390 domain-containing protein n=1 Tax=Thioalkalivibrio sp. XN8 TaxID=2712863 RepID=UPI0013EB138F|nr:DUF4390 domain-containing protein [Thioalkalivibrio sp. XN8]NGP53465.1 DUF4390 domain-containing protein [Thioalkalivibrio sp. XN8]
MRHAQRRNDTWAWRLLLAACVLALCAVRPLPAADGLAVSNATTRLEDGVWYLDADVDFQLNRTALDALASGLLLDIELEIRLERRRRIIWDAEFAELKQRYQLQFHALTERYILRNLNSGEQASYASLPAALAQLGQVRSLPLIDDALLDPDERYYVQVRAVVDIKRDGGPLALIRVFWNDWRIESDWIRWRLGR